KLLTVCAVAALCMIVMPGLLITTSSPAPGTMPVLQSAAVSQSSFPLIHVTVLGSVRSSNHSTPNRLPVLFFRLLAWPARPDEIPIRDRNECSQDENSMMTNPYERAGCVSTRSQAGEDLALAARPHRPCLFCSSKSLLARAVGRSRRRRYTNRAVCSSPS